MSNCSECARLHGESATAFAEYLALKDELAMTLKSDALFVVRRRAFERAQGQLGECHKDFMRHRLESHGGIDAARYRSGEPIKKGDRVLFHGNSAEIELVSTNPENLEEAWHVKEFGGGVLIHDPMVSGHTFIPMSQIAECEDLVFVSRDAGDR